MDALTVKFSAMDVKTELADEYLKNNSELKPIGSIFDMTEDDFVTTYDKVGTKIYVLKINSKDDVEESSGYIKKLVIGNESQRQNEHEQLKEELTKKFKLLAQKIGDNSDLIAQLEYRIRNKTIGDTKTNLHLITQNLLHWSIEFMNKSVTSAFLILETNAPLLDLGFITHLLLTYKHIVIVACRQLAVVCHLFTKLCHKVGLDNITLVFFRNIDEVISETASVGVITEKSDLDSAVDIFLTSTHTEPWRLQRILVQESVYEQFKDLLTWKTNLKSANSTDISDLKNMCSDVFQYDAKLFLLDCVCALKNFDQQLIFVEAYRTVKEVMTMIEEYKAFYVSLWSSDINEANEIAYSIPAQVVWINDFANFNGPPKASQAIYSKMDSIFSSIKIKKTSEITELSKLMDDWVKLSKRKRHAKVLEAINTFIGDSVNTTEGKLAVDIRNSLVKSDQFVEVTEHCLCVGIEKSVGIVMSDNNYVPLILSLVIGNGVIFMNKHFSNLITVLRNAGAPIATLEGSQKGSLKVAYDCPYKTKVVWTNFGTIFAN